MNLRRRALLRLAAGVVAQSIISRAAVAQAYPARALRIVIGFPSGSAVDTVARIIGQWLSERLGQPVIIEAKPGAATNLAMQVAIASPPDGYTLAMLGSSTVINASFFHPLPFDHQRDLAPVSGLVTFPMVLDATMALPAKTVTELITLAKANPGKINMASFGTGTTSHLAGELFKAMAGIDLVHVPYRGSPPAHVDLISGQVQIMFDSLTASLPHIQAGAFRALAVTGSSRFGGLPDVPRIADTILGFEASAWAGLSVPSGVPSDIVYKLSREINAGLADPTIKSRLAQLAAMPMPLSPAAFGAFVAAETEKWAKVVKFSGARPQ
jgi:tripartite-type tricarboxylate transporter receptor subunit TctC